MPVFSPESRYSDRLNRVLNYAHFNHHDRFHLDQLADIACLSKFHFIRVFQNHIGESPIQYLKRTRLERAGSLLKNETQLSVMEISHRCGFSSAKSFAREFGNSFGLAPKSFRTAHLNQLEDNTESGYLKRLYKQFTTLNLNPDLERSAKSIHIKALEPTRVAYIRSIGRYGGCDFISSSMRSIKEWAETQGLWSDTSEIIGISWDFSSMTPDSMRRYDTGVVIPPELTLHPGISCQTIPGGLYAIAQVPYQYISELIPIWKWFSMTLTSTKKFSMFRPRINTGHGMRYINDKLKVVKTLSIFMHH